MLSSEKLLSLCNDTKTLNSLYHTAHKKIEVYNPETGKAEKPDTENGYKFELFIHNFLPFCKEGKFGAMKVNREDEFGPVKNANGKDGVMVNDSPASARALLLAQHTRWASSTCEKLGKAEHDDFEKEIDLLLTYEGEGDGLTACC
jgi:UDP-N-acetylglucosamine pyrophosphorylase